MGKERAIEIRIPNNLTFEKQILSEIFIRIGYPFAFVQSFTSIHAAKIAYAVNDDVADIFIKKMDDDWKNISFPSTTKIENTWLVYLPGKKPTTLIKKKTLDFDIVGMGYFFLSGKAMELEKKNLHIFIELCKYPLFDIACDSLKKIIITSTDYARLYSNTPSLWPNNAKLAVVISHDIDHIVMGGISKVRYIFSNNRNNFQNIKKKIVKIMMELYNYGPKNSYAKIDRCIEIEKCADIRSTFFVYAGEPAFPFNPLYLLDDIILWKNKRVHLFKVLYGIEKEGWEIGLHGSICASQEENYLQDEYNNIVRRLPNINLMSIRHHRLSFDYEKTWDLHKKRGFLIDSTIGCNRINGFAAGTAFPFTVLDNDNNTDKLLEVPVIVQDIVVNRYIRKHYNSCVPLIKDICEVINNSGGGVLTQIWHIERMSGRSGNKMLTCFKDVLSYLAGLHVWFATLSQVREAWLEKKKELIISNE